MQPELDSAAHDAVEDSVCTLQWRTVILSLLLTTTACLGVVTGFLMSAQLVRAEATAVPIARAFELMCSGVPKVAEVLLLVWSPSVWSGLDAIGVIAVISALCLPTSVFAMIVAFRRGSSRFMWLANVMVFGFLFGCGIVEMAIVYGE